MKQSIIKLLTCIGVFACLLFSQESKAQVFLCGDNTIASFTTNLPPSPACGTNPVYFYCYPGTNTASFQHLWNFQKMPAPGEGQMPVLSSTDPNPIVTLPDDGTYLVTHNLVRGDTCFYTSAGNITVNLTGDANFSSLVIVGNGCEDVITYSFIPVERGLTGHSWTFPGGTPSSSTLPEPVVTFPAPLSSSTVNVTHTITRSTACGSSTVTLPFNLEPALNADFKCAEIAFPPTYNDPEISSTVCEGLLRFCALNDPSGSIHVWATAGTSVAQPMVYTPCYYATFAPGTYTVTHTIIYNGCVKVATRTFIVVPYSTCGLIPPIPAFRPGSEDNSISINNQHGKVTVTTHQNSEGQLIISDLLGRVVVNKMISQGDQEIDLSEYSFAPEMYIAQFKVGNSIVSRQKFLYIN